MFRVAKGATAIGVLLAIGVMASSCSSEGSASAGTAPATTPVEESKADYAARVQRECPGEDPGFDAFFTAHPSPTLADWVAFLPKPIASITKTEECIAGSNPPSSLLPLFDEVLGRLHNVRRNLEAALSSAANDDEDGMNRLIEFNRFIEVPRLTVAEGEVAGTGSGG